MSAASSAHSRFLSAGVPQDYGSPAQGRGSADAAYLAPRIRVQRTSRHSRHRAGIRRLHRDTGIHMTKEVLILKRIAGHMPGEIAPHSKRLDKHIAAGNARMLPSAPEEPVKMESYKTGAPVPSA